MKMADFQIRVLHKWGADGTFESFVVDDSVMGFAGDAVEEDAEDASDEDS